MEKQSYKIGRITYTLSELTYGQDKALVCLYNSVKNSAFKNEELRLKDLPDLLAKYNLLDKFFGIILNPARNFFFIFSFKWIKYYFRGEICLDRATNTQIGDIFNDFFLLNKKFGNILKEYMNTLGLIANEAEKMKLVTKAE
jgi:hypothetical protein